MTASLYQAGDVATLAVHGALDDQVGDEARGPSVGRRLYRTKDGWVTVFCATDAEVAQLGTVAGGEGAKVSDERSGAGADSHERPGAASAVGVAAVAAALEVLTTDDVLTRLRQAGVPAAPSV